MQQATERAVGHFHRKAKALSRRIDGTTFHWLMDNPDVLSALANTAIDAAKEASAALPVVDKNSLGPRPPQHLICELLAQLALALDEAIAAGKTLADEIIPSEWGGHSPAVIMVLRAILNKLLSKAVDLALEATGLATALRMARIGAVTFCPDVNKHPAVKACGAPLVEEPVADGIASSLRDLAAGLAR